MLRIMHRTTSLEVPRLHPECMQTAVSENPIIDACNNSGNSSAEGDAPERTRKRAKFEPLSEEGVGAAEEEAKEGAGKRAWNKWAAPVDLPSRSLLVARPLSEMKGHTAFLTFAVRPSRTKLSASCGATGDNAETSVEEVLGEPKNTANDLQAI